MYKIDALIKHWVPRLLKKSSPQGEQSSDFEELSRSRHQGTERKG